MVFDDLNKTFSSLIMMFSDFFTSSLRVIVYIRANETLCDTHEPKNNSKQAKD